MLHAVQGAGGVGGLLAAALSHAGEQVLIIGREGSGYPGSIRLESPVLGRFAVDVPMVTRLAEPVDVLWVAVKATGLDAVPDAVPDPAGVGLVVPLLNGVDHVASLREHFPRVAAGVIRVESERVAPGHIVHRSPFVRVGLATVPGEPADAGASSDATGSLDVSVLPGPTVADVAEALRHAGIDATVSDDETTLLWDKLVFLAPAALATTARDAAFGAVREDADFLGCQGEAFAAARASGARIDEAAARAMTASAPAQMRSSMQRDVDAGRPPELAAIAGPILGSGAPVPHTEALVAVINARRRDPGAATTTTPWTFPNTKL